MGILTHRQKQHMLGYYLKVFLALVVAGSILQFFVMAPVAAWTLLVLVVAGSCGGL